MGQKGAAERRAAAVPTDEPMKIAHVHCERTQNLSETHAVDEFHRLGIRRRFRTNFLFHERDYGHAFRRNRCCDLQKCQQQMDEEKQIPHRHRSALIDRDPRAPYHFHSPRRSSRPQPFASVPVWHG